MYVTVNMMTNKLKLSYE